MTELGEGIGKISFCKICGELIETDAHEQGWIHIGISILKCRTPESHEAEPIDELTKIKREIFCTVEDHRVFAKYGIFTCPRCGLNLNNGYYIRAKLKK